MRSSHPNCLHRNPNANPAPKAATFHLVARVVLGHAGVHVTAVGAVNHHSGPRVGGAIRDIVVVHDHDRLVGDPVGP